MCSSASVMETTGAAGVPELVRLWLAARPTPKS